MKNITIVFFLFAVLLLVESCDKFHTYKFILKNESDFPISIFIKTKYSKITDTLGTGSQIAVFDDFTSKSNLYCETKSSLLEFIDSIKISRIDSTLSLKKDIILCENWKVERYSKDKNSFIDFIFTITQKDF